MPGDALAIVDSHDRGAFSVLANSSATELDVAFVQVNWDSADHTDYPAGGYWVHVEGAPGLTYVAGFELGAFIDGPELSGRPTLPSIGTASYYGPTQGLIVQENGRDTPFAGSTMTGIFSSVIGPEADFDDMTVSACIGCSTPVHIVGECVEANEFVHEVDAENYGEAHFGPTPIQASAGFSGAQMRSVPDPRPTFTVINVDGAWGGRFSTIQNAQGDPRMVGGTYATESHTPAGTQAAYAGSYYAVKE